MFKPWTILAAFVACSAAMPCNWAAEQPRKTTVVYKKVGDLDVKADVYHYDDDTVRPVVVWIHGGALIVGHRDGIIDRVRKMANDNEYVLVSIDYRLAPETRLPAIIEDVEDAFTWLRSEGPDRFHIDPDRMAVVGGSAGGYLTLTTGFRVKPRPRALLALWGYGDLIGDWYSTPSPHARHHRVQLDDDRAWQQVSGAPVSDSRDRPGDGGAFYQYCRQKGSWPKAVSGWDPHTEAEKFFPFMPVKNVTADYPPTVLVHGTDDTDVPFVQSDMMAREFQRNGVEHEFIAIQGGEHGLGGGNPEKIEEAYERAFDFIKRRLQ